MPAAGLRARTLASLREISAEAWDALFPASYPFTRHAFLLALEAHGCVGAARGWEPCHLVLEDDAGVAAAMPLYRKHHSWGEFVFDFAWADASHQLGVPYYPKLLCAVPYTPASGPRVGARSEADRRHALGHAAALLGQGPGSLHALFLDRPDAEAAAELGWAQRHDVQFQWHNRGDADFEGFLARLSHDKRKKIRRERRRVAEAGIRFEWRRGEELDEAQWARVYDLYANTYEERGQAPYLTPAFFLDYGRRPGTPLRLVLASEGSRCVAVALTFAGGDTLYGRHWGCAERFDGLHFETCYYQGIELCLVERLARFDAGTQGAHKLARGFEPVITRSAHVLKDPRLARGVAAFLAHERAAIARRHALLAAHSPYREATVHDG